MRTCWGPPTTISRPAPDPEGPAKLAGRGPLNTLLGDGGPACCEAQGRSLRGDHDAGTGGPACSARGALASRQP